MGGRLGAFSHMVFWTPATAREQADHFSARIRLGCWHLYRLEGEPRRRAIAQIKHLVLVRNQWERLAADRP